MPSMVSAVAMMDRLVQAAVGGAGMPRGPPGATEPAILNAGGILAGTSSVAWGGSGWRLLFGCMPSLWSTRLKILSGSSSSSGSIGGSKVSLRVVDGPKGAGLFANRRIGAGTIVAYYPIEVINDPGFDSRDPLRDYFVEVKHSNGHVAENFVGRPDLRAVHAAPTRGLSSIGLFANEPSGSEQINAELESVQVAGPLFNGRKLKQCVRVRAIKPIKLNEEILLCYGSEYTRVGYESSCDCSRCRSMHGQ